MVDLLVTHASHASRQTRYTSHTRHLVVDFLVTHARNDLAELVKRELSRIVRLIFHLEEFVVQVDLQTPTQRCAINRGGGGVASGQRAADSGLRTAGCGLRAVGSGGVVRP